MSSPGLSPFCAVRVLAAEPGLAPEAAAALVGALDRLLVQFAREGRCTAHQVEVQQDGRFVVIAWDGGAPLSGCSHDKLSQVISQHEARSGVALLSSPPIAIGAPGNIRLVDRAGLRALRAAQQADGTTPVWHVRAATLAEWQAGPRPLADTAFGSEPVQAIG